MFDEACHKTRPPLLICIPTFNRAEQVVRAVHAALAQECNDVVVAVIDDASTDATEQALQPYSSHRSFIYVKLGRNVGTAQAKNAALALLSFRAITFHDSDDIPHPQKLLLQSRTLDQPNVKADMCLNWRAIAVEPGSNIEVAAALTEHVLVAADGSRHHVRRALSLVDDFFPHMQMAAGPPGDWILINSGLFRRDVFHRHGCFADSVEEDREFRNRLIMAGEILWLVDCPLLTKIDSVDSLTVAQQTGYASERRAQDRQNIWDSIAKWRSTGQVPHEQLRTGLHIAYASRPEWLSVAPDIPMTDDARSFLQQQCSRLVSEQI